MTLDARSGARATLLAFVGVAVFAHWSITDPTHDTSSHQSWWYVLAFSGMILGIAAGTVAVAQLIGRAARRPSFVAAAGAGLASAANIVEDGLQLGWAFFATVVGTVVLLAGLLATVVITLVRTRDRGRVLALVPAGTAAGILLYVEAGGPIMLVTWLVAGVLALVSPTPDRRARQLADSS